MKDPGAMRKLSKLLDPANLSVPTLRSEICSISHRISTSKYSNERIQKPKKDARQKNHVVAGKKCTYDSFHTVSDIRNFICIRKLNDFKDPPN